MQVWRQIRHLVGGENQRVDTLARPLRRVREHQFFHPLSGVELVRAQLEGVVALGLGLRVGDDGVAHRFGELDG